MATREINGGWDRGRDDSDNFRNNRNWRNNSSNRTTTYYCPESSCYNTVSSSGEYCSYHQREREQGREAHERREREVRLEQERRNEEQRRLEYQRRQEEQLRRERREREARRIMEERQRREIEERRDLERKLLEEQMRREREAQRAEEQRLMEEERRRCEARRAELRKLEKELDEKMKQLKLEKERKKRELEEKLRQPRYHTYRTRHDPVSSQCNSCDASGCQNKIDLGYNYCYNHANKCQESGCLTRILGSKNYCPSHKKQTLHCWKKEGKITDQEASRLSEFNLDDKYTLNQIREILEEDAYVNDSPIISNTITEYADYQTIIRDNLSSSLKRVRPKLALAVAGGGGSSGSEVIPFSTWFNAKCATIVSKLNWIRLFDVWVAVYEAPVRKMEGFMDIIWVSEHSDRNRAREKAAILRKEMNEERPALYITPSLQVFYNNGDYLFVNIIKVDLPINGDIIENPSEYLLPLDIVERSSGGSIGSGGSYRHAAIYLGKDPKEPDKKRKHKVCHVFAPGPSRSQSASIGSSAASGTTAGSSVSGPSGGSSSGGATLSSASFSEKKKAKARIDSWETFLTDNPKELIRYRITIPFKKYEKEIEQITKAVVTEFGKGNYHLVDRNCEHFAFNISCGVNFSEQEQVNRDKWYRKFLYRRGSKIEKMDLEREINKSDELFDNLVSGSMEEETISDKEVVKKFEEIEKWSRDRSLFKVPQESKIEVRVIIPPKYHNWK